METIPKPVAVPSDMTKHLDESARSRAGKTENIGKASSSQPEKSKNLSGRTGWKFTDEK